MALRSLLVSTVLALAAPAWCAAADGTPDPGFGSDGIAYLVHDIDDAREITPSTMLVQPDGKLLIAGTRNRLLDGYPIYEPEVHSMLARLNADGSPDSDFGNVASVPGLLALPDLLPGTRMQVTEAMQRAQDGSIFVAGAAFVNMPLQGFVAKFDANGNPDASFGDSGVVLVPAVHFHALGLDSQGRLVVCGERVDGPLFTATVMRLRADGSLDADFGSAGEVTLAWSGGDNRSGYANSLSVAADDGVTVGGSFDRADFGSDYALARLHADGSLDSTFAGSGWRVFNDAADPSPTNAIKQIAALPDGRIVFAGYHQNGENRTGLSLGRVAADGSTDSGFGDPATPGYLTPAVLPDAETVAPTALAVQGDGKLVVPLTYYADAKQLFVVYRATADGLTDAAFANGGVFQADLAPSGVGNDLTALALQPDGRIVLAGRSLPGTDWSIADLGAVRLLNSVAPPDRIFANGFD